MSLDLSGKRIELLKEIVPQVRRLAVLTRPEHAGEHRERAVSEEVAAKLGMAIAYVPIQTASELDDAFQAIARQKLRRVGHVSRRRNGSPTAAASPNSQ
jgi:putative ABC transport system substrate-binding protein